MPGKQKRNQTTSTTMQLPTLVGTAEFTPTGLMVQTLSKYLLSLCNTERKSAIMILSEDGHSKQNWYNWIYRKPGFMTWWNKVITDYHANYGLADVHNAIYRRAIGNSPQDAKMFLERFDDDYRPTSKTEMELTPGMRPPDLKDSQARSEAKRKAVLVEELKALPAQDLEREQGQ